MALGRAGVVGEDVADVAGLPAGVADRVAGVRDLELRQLLDVRVDDLGEAPQQPGTVGRVTPPARTPDCSRARAMAASAASTSKSSISVTSSSVAGLMTAVCS